MNAKKNPIESVLLPIVPAPLAKIADAGVEHAVRPQHVDQAEQERGDDDQRAKHDAKRQAWNQDRPEQRLVERKQPHESEIDHDHRSAEHKRDRQPFPGQGGAARHRISIAGSNCVHICPLKTRDCASPCAHPSSFSRAPREGNYGFLQSAVRGCGTPSASVVCMSGSRFRVFLRKARTARMRGANCRSLWTLSQTSRAVMATPGSTGMRSGRLFVAKLGSMTMPRPPAAAFICAIMLFEWNATFGSSMTSASQRTESTWIRSSI